MANEPSGKQLIQKLLLELRELKGKVKRLEQAEQEPIAVIGMGCRFPGAESPAAFWQLVQSGTDAVREAPSDRWGTVASNDAQLDAAGRQRIRYGAYLDNVFDFDPDFFAMAPDEAINMDPQQRLLLEVAWEALEDAAVPPFDRRNVDTGIYVGYVHQDYVHHLGNHAPARLLNPHTLSGLDSSFLAGRLSYILGMQGPSVAVATACSSSLVSVHLACQALRCGECDQALAGGVNLILHPVTSLLLAKLAATSVDGRCKSFDARADGFGRGEGCGMVVLKRLSDAQAAGDRILAVVRGAAVNHDGSKALLTAPNGAAQLKLLARALSAAHMSADDIDYVEAHATGTLLGDAIEINSLAQIFGAQRERPLQVGSVKSNFAHLEAAAGIAGLCKVILSLQHNEIPPNRHFDHPNPEVPWDRIPIQVPTERTAWPKGKRPRAAGISAFGLSGINAHVIVEEAPTRTDAAGYAEQDDPPYFLLPLSAQTEAALHAQTERYLSHLESRTDQRFGNICHTAAIGREHFALRRSVVAATAADAVAILPSAPATAIVDQPKIGFIFPGQSALRAQMGRELYRFQPAFRAAMEECAQGFQPLIEHSLVDMLYPHSGERQPPANHASSDIDAASLGQPQYAQPALFALEYALTQLWRSWGIQPAMLFGSGVGEIAAACAAGIVDLEGGIQLVSARARLMQARSAPEAESRSQTVAQSKQSHLAQAALDEFARVAGKIPYRLSQISFVSSATGSVAREEVATADYWMQHLQQTEAFAQGIDTMVERRVTAFLEIGPGSTLMEKRQHSPSATEELWLPSLDPQHEWRQLLTTLGALYGHGVEIDWHGVARGYRRERVELPTYPFQRRFCGVRPAPGSPQTVDMEGVATNGHGDTPSQTELNHVRRQTRAMVPPSSPTERQLAAIWSDLLGVEDVGLYDNFFELGGNSVMVTQVTSSIREIFQIELQLQSLFEESTLHALAEAIDTQVWAAAGIEEDEQKVFEL